MGVIGTQSLVPVGTLIGGHQVLILSENRALVSEGAVSTSLDPIGSPGNLGVEHVINPHLDLAWRSSSIAALVTAGETVLTLQIRFGAPRRIDTLMPAKSNVRTAIRGRFYASTQGSPGGETPLFESPWTDPIVRARLEDFPTYTSMPSYSLGPSEEDLDFWQLTFALTSPIFADKPYDNVRMVEIDFDLTAINGNDGVDYFQVGFLPCWLSFRPKINYELGASHGVIDESETTRIKETGALLGRERSRRRTFDFTLETLDRVEGLQRILTAIMRRQSKLSRLFIWPEPLQRRFFYDTAILGTLTRLPKIVEARLDKPIAARSWRIEETE